MSRVYIFCCAVLYPKIVYSNVDKFVDNVDNFDLKLRVIHILQLILRIEGLPRPFSVDNSVDNGENRLFILAA